MIKIKVCGMRDKANIMEIGKLKPDFMGFIFYEHSPRFVRKDFVLPEDFCDAIQKTGVFVNAATGYVLETVKKYRLDYVQLHGDESAAYCEELKLKDVKVIKTFPVDKNFDFESAASYENAVEFFLFDTKGKNYGGNAAVFDWNVLQKYNLRTPFFLSGGLSPENIHGVLKLKYPTLFAVDLNSGVELTPGLKDINKVSEIIKNLKSKI